jgi:hypothetical protein
VWYKINNIPVGREIYILKYIKTTGGERRFGRAGEKE